MHLLFSRHTRLFPEKEHSMSESIAVLKRYHRFFHRETLPLLSISKCFVLIGEQGAITVKDNQLRIKQGVMLDGQDENPVEISFERGKGDLERIICLTRSYNISGWAIEWMQKQDVSLLQVNWHEKLVSSLERFEMDNFPEIDNRQTLWQLQKELPEERRIQIAKWLVQDKIDGQKKTLEQWKGRIGTVSTLAAMIDDCDYMSHSVLDAMLIERSAASAYWTHLAQMPIKWDSRSKKTIPASWLNVGERASSLSTGNNAQHAVSPFHSALNWLGAVLDRRIYIHILRYGLNPSTGILHANKGNRASLIYDLKEHFRPMIEDRLLDIFVNGIEGQGLLKSFFHTLSHKDYDGEIQVDQDFGAYIINACLPREIELDRHVRNFVQFLKKGV